MTQQRRMAMAFSARRGADCSTAPVPVQAR
jgi:hypothetical protein